MGERPISNVPFEEFDAVIEAYIERETKDAADQFFRQFDVF